MVKAVYIPGEWLDKNYNELYSAVGPIKYGQVKSGIYSAEFEYRRINALGCGVTKVKSLSVQIDLQQVGASDSTAIEIKLDNGEVIPVMLTPTSAVDTVGYILKTHLITII